jgi:mannose-6-phosphate isomerase-like protein (cupin superfamily)
MRFVIQLDDLPHTRHAHEFVGADYGDVPVSLILVHSEPGAGPAVHRHPYAELFVVESGQATFQLGDSEIVVKGGQIVIGPPDIPHAFTNTGTGELRLTAIHCAPKFITEWEASPDPVWVSPPRGGSSGR